MAAVQGTSLKTYLLTRLLLVVPMVLILLTFVFLLMRVAPGDPISASLGGHVPQSVIDQITHRLGFDKPLYQQYFEYLWDVLRGNFGTTITDQRPVSDIILTNGAATLELTFFAMIVAVVVGVVVGLVAGRFRDTSLDVGGRLFGIVIYAMPVFFLGLMAQLFFGSYLGWLPTSGRASPITQATLETHTNLFIVDSIIDRNWAALKDVILHLILPAVTLGLVTAGVFIRLIRVNVIRTMKDDYIEAARARGIRERDVVYRHAFKNALVPVITVDRADARRLLLGGAVLTETTFNWPGIGHELVLYLENRDYTAVQGIVIVFGLVVVRRQPGDRLRERVHRPEDPVLMAAPGQTPPRRRSAGGCAARARPRRSADRRGARLPPGDALHRRGHHGRLRADRDPRAADLALRLRPVPVRTAAASRSLRRRRPTHLMGTTVQSTDVLSRVIWGAQTELKVVVISLVFAITVGVPLGLLSGYFGGKLDRGLVLVMDAMYAFPYLLLAIVIAFLLSNSLGKGVLTAAIAITAAYVPLYFRVVRNQVIALREESYVEAARALGAKPFTIIRKYVFHNVVQNVPPIATLNAADAILVLTALGFLGYGIQPTDAAEWGYDISRAVSDTASGIWWTGLFPGLAIVLLVTGLTLLGEGLNETMNPVLRRRRIERVTFEQEPEAPIVEAVEGS